MRKKDFKVLSTPKKYELTDETISLPSGRVLHRIKAIRDFHDVHKGDLGGYIESEANLAHYGDCWVYNNAKVWQGAVVRGNAIAKNNAIIRDYACITDNAIIKDNAEVREYAIVGQNITLEDNVTFCRGANVNAFLWDNVAFRGNSIIYDYINDIYEIERINRCGY